MTAPSNYAAGEHRDTRSVLAVALSAAFVLAAMLVGTQAAVAAFLVDHVGRVWSAAQTWAQLSPFHYFSPLELVMGTPLRAAHLAVLLGVGCAGIATSDVLFARRDI